MTQCRVNVARGVPMGFIGCNMGFKRWSGAWIVLVMLAAGCGRQPSSPPAPVAPKTGALARPPLHRVLLQTDWFPQAEHGGYYQALARGFYAEAGLDVTLLPGGPGAGTRLKLTKGDVDFAMMKSDDVIVAAARGLPFVMVAATMQRDPGAVMVHADSPVQSLRDLDGRVVIASTSMTWIPYLQKKYGITFDLKPNPYGLGEFLANKEAIQQCIVTNEPFFAQQQGRHVRTLLLADSGYDCYPALVCRQELLRTSAAMIRTFVHQSIRGWRDYLQGDPAPADALIRERNSEMTPELMRFSRNEMIARSLVGGDPARGEDIGQLSLPRLEAEMQTLLKLKILDAPIPIASVATRQFLPAAAK